MSALSFRVYGEAVAKGSMKPLAFQVKDAAGNPVYRLDRHGKQVPVLRAFAQHDNPRTKSWQQLVAEAAAAAIGATRNRDRTTTHIPAWQVLDGPVRLSLAFYFSRPKSLPKRTVANVKGYDSDKLARLVADALSRVAYHDDKQIVELIVGKYYAAPNEPAHCDVRVEPTAGLRPAEWPAAPAPLFQEPLFAEGVS